MYFIYMVVISVFLLNPAVAVAAYFAKAADLENASLDERNKLLKNVNKSVFLIKVDNRFSNESYFGTGFFVNEKKPYAITSRHFLESIPDDLKDPSGRIRATLNFLVENTSISVLLEQENTFANEKVDHVVVSISRHFNKEILPYQPVNYLCKPAEKGQLRINRKDKLTLVSAKNFSDSKAQANKWGLVDKIYSVENTFTVTQSNVSVKDHELKLSRINPQLQLEKGTSGGVILRGTIPVGTYYGQRKDKITGQQIALEGKWMSPFFGTTVYNYISDCKSAREEIYRALVYRVGNVEIPKYIKFSAVDNLGEDAKGLLTKDVSLYDSVQYYKHNAYNLKLIFDKPVKKNFYYKLRNASKQRKFTIVNPRQLSKEDEIVVVKIYDLIGAANFFKSLATGRLEKLKKRGFELFNKCFRYNISPVCWSELEVGSKLYKDINYVSENFSKSLTFIDSATARDFRENSPSYMKSQKNLDVFSNTKRYFTKSLLYKEAADFQMNLANYCKAKRLYEKAHEYYDEAVDFLGEYKGKSAPLKNKTIRRFLDDWFDNLKPFLKHINDPLSLSTYKCSKQ